MLHRVSNTEESQLLQKMIIEDAQRELLLEMGGTNGHRDDSSRREIVRASIGISFMFATTTRNSPFLPAYNHELNVINDTALARDVDNYFTRFSQAYRGVNTGVPRRVSIFKLIPKDTINDLGDLISDLERNPDFPKISVFKKLHKMLMDEAYPPSSKLRSADEVDNRTRRKKRIMRIIDIIITVCLNFIKKHLNGYVTAGFIDPQEAATIQQQFQTQYPNGIVRPKPRRWK